MRLKEKQLQQAAIHTSSFTKSLKCAFYWDLNAKAKMHSSAKLLFLCTFSLSESVFFLGHNRSHLPCWNMMPQYESTAEQGLCNCFRVAQFLQGHGLGLCAKAAVEITAAEHAGPCSKGWVLLQVLLCSQVLCWALMSIHTSDRVSLPGDTPTFTTGILQRKPARF